MSNFKQKRKKSLSRLIAIQSLYQFDFFEGKKNLSDIEEDVIENYALEENQEITSYRSKIDEALLKDLLLISLADIERIDAEITQLLKNPADFNKMDEVVKQVLRLGTFELQFMKDTPLKVVLDEYVDIAASFFDDKKITFVNGILDKMAQKFRTEEFEKLKS